MSSVDVFDANAKFFVELDFNEDELQYEMSCLIPYDYSGTSEEQNDLGQKLFEARGAFDALIFQWWDGETAGRNSHSELLSARVLRRAFSKETQALNRVRDNVQRGLCTAWNREAISRSLSPMEQTRTNEESEHLKYLPSPWETDKMVTHAGPFEGVYYNTQLVCNLIPTATGVDYGEASGPALSAGEENAWGEPEQYGATSSRNLMSLPVRGPNPRTSSARVSSRKPKAMIRSIGPIDRRREEHSDIRRVTSRVTTSVESRAESVTQSMQQQSAETLQSSTIPRADPPRELSSEVTASTKGKHKGKGKSSQTRSSAGSSAGPSNVPPSDQPFLPSLDNVNIAQRLESDSQPVAASWFSYLGEAGRYGKRHGLSNIPPEFLSTGRVIAAQQTEPAGGSQPTRSGGSSERPQFGKFRRGMEDSQTRNAEEGYFQQPHKPRHHKKKTK